MAGRRTNSISELTRTLGMGDGYWIRVLVYVTFAIFVLFFVTIVFVFIS